MTDTDAQPVEDDDEDVCGLTYDHEERITYDGPDGLGWECLRCGAEGWEDRDEETKP